MSSLKVPDYLYLIFCGLCLSTLFSPPLALAAGIFIGLVWGQPFANFTTSASKWLLQGSVVALGFGMNLGSVWTAGKLGFWFTVGTILGTLALGYVLGRWLKVEKKTSMLISSGTAICGGSAIAAVGLAIDADKRAMSVSLGIVFILNAVALFLFPVLGHALDMSQAQFGLWSAISIHDTSSVVGAAAKYGDEALAFATPIKLARALWIIPLALTLGALFTGKSKVRIPWFILFFLLAALLRTLLPEGAATYDLIRDGGKIGLTLTLFFIGTGLSREAIRAVGPRVLAQGFILWVFISIAGLIAVQELIP